MKLRSCVLYGFWPCLASWPFCWDLKLRISSRLLFGTSKQFICLKQKKRRFSQLSHLNPKAKSKQKTRPYWNCEAFLEQRIGCFLGVHFVEILRTNSRVLVFWLSVLIWPCKSLFNRLYSDKVMIESSPNWPFDHDNEFPSITRRSSNKIIDILHQQVFVFCVDPKKHKIIKQILLRRHATNLWHKWPAGYRFAAGASDKRHRAKGCLRGRWQVEKGRRFWLDVSHWFKNAFYRVFNRVLVLFPVILCELLVIFYVHPFLGAFFWYFFNFCGGFLSKSKFKRTNSKSPTG